VAQLCRHQGCTCAARSDGYCSDVCTGSAEPGQPCLCGHDECQAPTKAEGFMAVADLAPEGRFVERPTRDW
jgi:hypothetical protein